MVKPVQYFPISINAKAYVKKGTPTNNIFIKGIVDRDRQVPIPCVGINPILVLFLGIKSACGGYRYQPPILKAKASSAVVCAILQQSDTFFFFFIIFCHCVKCSLLKNEC